MPISTKHPQNPPTIVIFSVILPTWQCSIKSTQIALTWETFKLILHVSDMKPRASQTLHEVKVSDILEEEREGFRRSEALQFIKEWIDVTMLEDQLLVAKTGAGECESKGRRVLAATTEGEHHYWGGGETAGSADLCTLLYCSGLDTECNRSCRKSTRKLLKSTTRPSTWEPWLEFLQWRHIALELYIWVSFCKTGKILELCLILTYFNQGGQMCPHPKYANTYTRKNQWVKFW